MKNLANCNPREFLVQTNKIRKAVKEWLTLTKVMELRGKLPERPEDMSDAEWQKVVEAKMTENANAMLNAILDEHPNETADLLGLMCFIEPEDLDNHPMTELLGSFSEMLSCKEVIDFFTSLMRLGLMNGSTPAKA